MTPPTPILEALPALRGAIYRALTALTTRGVFWKQATQGYALPFVIYQSPDGGGRAEKSVGDLDWSGLIMVRALADNQSAAEQLMTAVAGGMAALSAPGYTITVTYGQPRDLPITPSGAWQAAHEWRISISRS